MSSRKLGAHHRLADPALTEQHEHLVPFAWRSARPVLHRVEDPLARALNEQLGAVLGPAVLFGAQPRPVVAHFGRQALGHLGAGFPVVHQLCQPVHGLFRAPSGAAAHRKGLFEVVRQVDLEDAGPVAGSQHKVLHGHGHQKPALAVCRVHELLEAVVRGVARVDLVHVALGGEDQHNIRVVDSLGHGLVHDAFHVDFVKPYAKTALAQCLGHGDDLVVDGPVVRQKHIIARRCCAQVELNALQNLGKKLGLCLGNVLLFPHRHVELAREVESARPGPDAGV
mmetsp:Transcript_18573/g.59279  ORF Transcript_18573/g.59279 Transcript_18573/m.59279 type:complete len:282 (+) Transcript_18573:259-1104(+)